MSDNLSEQFIIAARSYSDKRLLNTIEQPHNFSKEKVEAAKVVALERGIMTEESMNQLSGDAEILKNAKNMLEGGRDADEVMKVLVSRGATEESAMQAVHQASKIADMNKKHVVEESDGGSKWWYFIVIFFVVRIILRLLNNN